MGSGTSSAHQGAAIKVGTFIDFAPLSSVIVAFLSRLALAMTGGFVPQREVDLPTYPRSK